MKDKMPASGIVGGAEIYIPPKERLLKELYSAGYHSGVAGDDFAREDDEIKKALTKLDKLREAEIK